jgi:hypothetical protein
MKSMTAPVLMISLVVMCAITAANASDRDFKGVVHAIEADYGVHHMHIPLLGVAMFFARPEGVSGMKLAVFEDFHAPADTADFVRLVEDSLGEGWYPFVKVRSQSPAKGDGETTLIYASPSGGKLRMMIVNLESSEATVVEFNLSEHAIQGWIKEPGEMADDHRHHHFD